LSDARPNAVGESICIDGEHPNTSGEVLPQILQQVLVDIPVTEYALLLRLESSTSSVVVCDSANLDNSESVPYEVFPTCDIYAGGDIGRASPEELEQAGLLGIFTPRIGAAIGSVVLGGPQSTQGSLLLKIREDQSTEDMLALCGTKLQELTAILDEQKRVAAAYEWEIHKTVLHSTEPCLIADPDGCIVSANAMFCHLVGVSLDDLIGAPLQEFIHLQEDIQSSIANLPAHEEMVTPLYVKTQSLFFMSDICFSRLRTVCGDRFLFAFRDLMTDQRTGNSNIQLAQKLSSMIMDHDSPQAILRKLVNVLTLSLDADLVCILKKNERDELVITPYSNRRLETLRVDFIEPRRESVLESYFRHGTPVFCEDVDTQCAQDSFFRRVLPMSRFAFIPAGYGRHSEHTLLVAWLGAGAPIDVRSLPLFRIVANLIGSVLAHARLLSEIEQEKETLRRYARLTAGRELRMARLKRENAQLKELVKKLDTAIEERNKE
jgi:PAS domain-containing protein